MLYARFSSATGAGITNTYDNVGELLSATTNMDGTARTLTSQYDADGNRTSLGLSGGGSGTFSYDGLDRLTSFTSGATSVAWFTYDQLGRRSSLAKGFGSAMSSTSYSYDGASRLQSLTFDLAGTANDQVLGFGYNPASQMVQRTRSNSGWEFTEQVLGTKSYGINGLNQYTTAAGATFAYDANGNLSSDGTNTYIYDAENRLVSVKNASGTVISTLSYDPMGRLWRFTSSASSTTLDFVYDGDQLLAEYDGSGVLQRAYAHGPGEDEPIYWFEVSDHSSRFFQADHQGSIVAVTDGSGNPIAIDKYDEWGVPSAANVGRFQYTGQVLLPDLGFYYYKARIYSSRLGRFLQTDPVGYKDQINLYAYVGNDPVDGRDPLGQFDLKAGSAVEAVDYQTEINSLSYTKYSFDEHNELHSTGTFNTGVRSRTFSKYIDRMIASRRTTILRRGDTYKDNGVQHTVASTGGGVTLIGAGKSSPITVITDGKSYDKAPAMEGGTLHQTPAQVDMHEMVVHALSAVMNIPESLANENKIRKEINLPLRAHDHDHPN